MNRGFVAALAISTVIHACLLWAVSADSRPIPLVTSGEICVEYIASPAAEPRPKVPAVPGTVSVTQHAEARKVSEPLPSQSKKEEKKLDKSEALVSPKSVEKQQPEKKKSSEPIRQPEPSPNLQKIPKRPDTKPLPSGEIKAPPVTSSSPQEASLPSSPKTQGVKTEARLLGYQKPDYPEEARLRGLEGEVVIALEISAEGRVVNAKLHTTSSHQILDDSALLFAESLRFVPARQGTTPVRTNVLQPVRYRLVDPY